MDGQLRLRGPRNRSPSTIPSDNLSRRQVSYICLGGLTVEARPAPLAVRATAAYRVFIPATAKLRIVGDGAKVDEGDMTPVATQAQAVGLAIDAAKYDAVATGDISASRLVALRSATTARMRPSAPPLATSAASSAAAKRSRSPAKAMRASSTAL